MLHLHRRVYRSWPIWLLLLSLPLGAAAQTDAPRHESKRTISVTGQGEVKITPDVAALSFAVETTAVRAAEAGAENAKRSGAVAAAVKALLGGGDTVATTRYALEPHYEVQKPGEPREPRITGYLARNEVQVESHQIDKVGALIDAATGAGANRVNGLRFTLAKREEATRAALEKAGADARAQADSVAKGLGVQLKGVLSASTSMPMAIPRRYDTMAMAAEMRSTTPIEPGEVSVSATLQVTYEIE